MKSLLVSIVAAVLVVGCGSSVPDISIHDAALYGEIEAVQQHLAAGTDVNAKSVQRGGNTPLHTAARYGHTEIAALLIAKGADVNAKDNNGETPLDWAKGKPEIIKILRQLGGKTSDELDGKTSEVKESEDSQPSPKSKITQYKNLPEVDIASFTDEQQATILMRANREGCDCGCKMTVGECRNEDSPCRTSVRLAIAIVKDVTGVELKNIAKTTKESTKPLMSIWKGAAKGNIEVVKQHLDAEVDKNAKNSDGESPLQLAAQAGQKEIIELLISKGADINTKDDFGWTPVTEAAREGHKGIVELLISHGAILNTMDKFGISAMHFAAARGHKEIVQLLISEGIDVNIKSDASTALDIAKTPLDLAVQHQREEIVDFLRKHGAKTSEEFKAAESIHDASKYGNVEAVKKHLAGGVDVNAKDGNGWTPLIPAAANGRKEVVELLIASGADVNVKSAFGTPLDWAKRLYDDYTPEAKAEIKETANLLRKHGGKTSEELKAEGK
jgi:cytohesin